MRKIMLAGLGVAILLVGSCSNRAQEAWDMADNAQEQALSAKAQLEDLERRVAELELRLGS